MGKVHHLNDKVSVTKVRAGVYHASIEDDLHPEAPWRLVVKGDLPLMTPEAVVQLVSRQDPKRGIYARQGWVTGEDFEWLNDGRLPPDQVAAIVAAALGIVALAVGPTAK